MENITILGAGASGLALAEKIRHVNNTFPITLIDKNSYSFCKNSIILKPNDISKRIKIGEWAFEKNINFINACVERVNIKRKKIYFKKEEPCDFSRLVVASGLDSKKLPIKGEHREGFFYLSQIDPIKLRDLLRVSSEVAICVFTWLGLRLAVALSSLGKEVRIISPDLDFLGGYKEEVMALLQKRNIFLHINSFIEEAVGESVVKAVKISPLKVFSSKIVIIDSGFVPNINFLEGDMFEGKNCFADLEDVCFLGDVGRKNIRSEIVFSSNNNDAKLEGQSFAEFILEGKIPVPGSFSASADSRDSNIDNSLKELEEIKLEA